jgi:hypothetical protein
MGDEPCRGGEAMRAALGAVLLMVQGGQVAALPFSGNTSCSEVGLTVLCSSGGGRGFNGQSWQTGPTRYWQGESDGKAVNCQEWAVGALAQWRCE